MLRLRFYILIHCVAIMIGFGLVFVALIAESQGAPEFLRRSGSSIALLAALVTLASQGVAIWQWATLRDTLAQTKG